MTNKLKILIITYYWPPAGGSGVQRWMYFSKYLKKMGNSPIVITVKSNYASYNLKDNSLLKEIEDIETSGSVTNEELDKFFDERGF